MTDRELLGAAAKAAGLVPDGAFGKGLLVLDGGKAMCFDPLNDDGTALRLAVKLRLSIIQEEEFLEGVRYPTVEVMSEEREDGSRICTMQSLEVDALAATRLAIVRAAAAIQQAKEAQ